MESVKQQIHGFGLRKKYTTPHIRACLVSQKNYRNSYSKLVTEGLVP